MHPPGTLCSRFSRISRLSPGRLLLAPPSQYTVSECLIACIFVDPHMDGDYIDDLMSSEGNVNYYYFLLLNSRITYSLIVQLSDIKTNCK